MKIDVCVCTHDPDPEKFGRTLDGLIRQTLPKQSLSVTIVDNASTVPLDPNHPSIAKLLAAGVEAKVLREPRLGVAYARLTGLQAMQHEALVFVDDDNVLEPEFLDEAVKILGERADVGVFSGKMLLPDSIEAPRWTRPLFGSLALKDCGEEPIIDWYWGTWAPWVPVATASMVVRKSVVDHFLNKYGSKENYGVLGRKGKKNLMSGEDVIITKSAAEVGLKCGYFPMLVMGHLVSPERFRFGYLLRLYAMMAISEYHQALLAGDVPDPFTFMELYKRFRFGGRTTAYRVKACFFVFHVIGIAAKTRLLLRHRRPLFKFF